MSYLSKLPLGSRALTEREVLESLIERANGEGEVADLARAELAKLDLEAALVEDILKDDHEAVRKVIGA